jgi:hypothetical protein
VRAAAWLAIDPEQQIDGASTRGRRLQLVEAKDGV